MRRHRRSAWGDITVDAGGYMNGVLYSKHRAARSHTSVTRKARQGAGVAVKAALRAIGQTGLQVSLIRDVTPIPHNGCRPPKRRRV